MRIAKKSKSPSTKMEELGKSRDPEGMICDNFREGFIGDDLKLSLLMMFNRIKDEVSIPELLGTGNITMHYAKKEVPNF